MRIHFALILSLLLSACATISNPLPDDFKGPIAYLQDTGEQEDGSKGKVFAATEIDGLAIQNSIRESRSASYGRGFALTSVYTSRRVPLRLLKVRVIGTHQTAAPIHELASRAAGTFFSVEGIVSFTPEEEHRYSVTGELSKEKSCVWIADVHTGKVVTEKACTN